MATPELSPFAAAINISSVVNGFVVIAGTC
jgi:hypothetical protein